MAYKQLQLRPNVRDTEQVHYLIAPGHCWHFDAWLYDAGDGLYLLTETRKGGRDLIASHAYRWDGHTLRYVARVPDGAALVTMHDKALWPRFDELNRLHWLYIVPMAARVPAGFRSRSVALHYVRAPSIAPFDGTEVNLHQYGE
jgi:hypothetical protein